MREILFEKNRFYYTASNCIYSKNFFLTIDDMRLKYMPDVLKRLFRIGIFKLVHYENYFIVVVKKKILIYNGIELLYEIIIDRGSRPLKDGLCVVGGNVFYGDYWGNGDRVSANVYKIDLKTGRKTVLYSFGDIRHIHFVQPDRSKENSLLIGTGDLDQESGIYRLNINSRELEAIGRGSQKFRAVSVIQKDNLLIWGSDDPDGENHIYVLSREAGELQKICKIDGPAYYSAVDRKGNIFIATTIEDRRKHKAIIYSSSDNGQSWSVYRQFKKDIWSSKYFGYGVVEFIDGQECLEKLSYSLAGLKEMK